MNDIVLLIYRLAVAIGKLFYLLQWTRGLHMQCHACNQVIQKPLMLMKLVHVTYYNMLN